MLFVLKNTPKVKRRDQNTRNCVIQSVSDVFVDFAMIVCTLLYSTRREACVQCATRPEYF